VKHGYQFTASILCGEISLPFNKAEASQLLDAVNHIQLGMYSMLLTLFLV
jgi:hypothetical protein